MKGNLNLSSIKNYENLPKTYQLLFLLFDLVSRKGNKIEHSKKDLAQFIEVKVQTAGAYLKELVDSNILKYRYGGPIFINPDFYYIGSEEGLEALRKDYARFVSTM